MFEVKLHKCTEDNNMNDTPGRVLILHHDQVRVQDKVPVCHNQRAQLKCKKLPDIKNKVIPVIWVFCAT